MDDAIEATSNKNKYVVCFGDSITQLGFASPRSWAVLLQSRLKDSAEGDKFIVHNAGAGGNTTAMALDRFHTDVLPFLPGIVIIEFGINDCFVNLHTVQNRITIEEFKHKLDELIRLIEAAGGRPVLVVNHFMNDDKSYKQGNGKTLSENLKPYNVHIRETEKQRSLPCVDMETMQLRNGVDIAKFLTDDGVHLSEYGMDVYAEFVWSVLRELL